ncbi:MAG: hypothetical protein AAGC55_20115, partial [Myxococcota bacterium]
ITDRVGRPLDAYAVSATLESQGLRDVDAREKFGYVDLLAFARDIYQNIEFDAPDPDSAVAPLPRRHPLVVLKHLLVGSLFAMPMLGQIFCLIVTRYSLWASLDFSEAQATVIGIGTLASFAVTGGLVMAIGRQGTIFRANKNYTMLRRLCAHLTALGVLIVIGCLGLALIVQLLTSLVSAEAFVIAAIYYVALSLLWLILAVFYMLNLHHYTVAVTVGCGLLVSVQVELLGVHVYAAQIIAIALCLVIAFAIAQVYLHRLVGKEDPKQLKSLPTPPDVQVGILVPFAAYGCCYFSLLFLDRLFAWTAPGRDTPEAIWFHVPYEIGLDWALCSLLIPMAYLEHVVREFSRRLQHEQHQLRLSELESHRRSMSRFFVRCGLILGILSLGSTLLCYHAIDWLQIFTGFRSLAEFFHHPVALWVYWPAAIGYQLLTFALMASLILFSLQRGEWVLRAIFRALLTAAVIGFLASWLFAPHWAVLGFAAGTAVFASGLLRDVLHLLRHIDYYFYSAY